MAMPGRSYSGPLPPLTPGQVEARDRMREHVLALAQEVGERHVWREPALTDSARYIEQSFREMGYEVAIQEYDVWDVTVRNLEVALPGRSLPDEIIIVGAHYDSVVGCPGANDNATGVAAVLDLARVMSPKRLARTVRLVAFVNEEPPFFWTDEMGSRVYARRARERGENIVAVLVLETIGCYSDVEGSQRYPFPLGLFYPGTGDFIAFVGNMRSRGLVRRAIGAFRRHAQFPSEGAALLGWIPGIGWSDHWSFWKEGYPAIMVTDTAPFRYEHYHTPWDVPAGLNYGRMARVVDGLARVIEDLAGADGQ